MVQILSLHTQSMTTHHVPPTTITFKPPSQHILTTDHITQYTLLKLTRTKLLSMLLHYVFLPVSIKTEPTAKRVLPCLAQRVVPFHFQIAECHAARSALFDPTISPTRVHGLCDGGVCYSMWPGSICDCQLFIENITSPSRSLSIDACGIQSHAQLL